MPIEPKRTGRRLQNIITPDRNKYRLLDLDSEEDSVTEQLQEEQQEAGPDIPPLHANRVVRRILQLSDSKTSESEADSSSTTSSMSGKSTNNVTIDADDLAARMEKCVPGITTTVKGKKDYAQVMRFRNTLGDALANLNCPIYDCGYSWLADTDKAHQERMGDVNAAPPNMPERPVDPGENAASSLRRKHKKEEKHYLACTEIRTIGIKLLEQKFPSCLALKYKKRGLPINITLKDCLDYVLKTVNTEVSKREAFVRLRKHALNIIYTHTPNSDSCVLYLQSLETIKEDIDALDIATVPIDEIIVYAQIGIQSGIGERKDLIRTIDSKWTAHKATDEGIIATTNGTDAEREAAVWIAFKGYYVDKLAQLDKDGLIKSGRSNNSANSVTEERFKILEERLDEQEADMYKIDGKMDSALSVVTEARYRVPDMVRTDTGSGTLSRLDSHNQSTRLFQSLQEYKARADRQEQRIRELQTQLGQQSLTKQPCIPVKRTDNNGTMWKQLIFYCWTHGCSHSHDSGSCTSQKPGHQSAATLENRMNGRPKAG